MLSLSSKIPGFRLTYGRNPSDHFTTFEIGKESKATTTKTYFNLELTEDHRRSSDDSCNESTLGKIKGGEDFGRIIFRIENVTNFIPI